MKQGLHIALLGPDGCGKSTLLPLLQERLASHFTGIELYHWRPKVFADAGIVAGARNASTGPNVDPHGKPPHRAPLGLARLFYYLADYWLGSLAIRRAKAAGRLVLFDRYAPDMACDPRRYRFGLSSGLLNWACRQVPQPDLGFVLVGDAEMLYERKREVPLASLQVLLTRYRALPQANPAYEAIDCGKTPQEVADEIAGKIIARLQNQSRQPA